MRALAMVLSATAVVAGCGVNAPGLPSPGQLRQGLEPVSSFGSNPGRLKMYRHVPAGLPAQRPLVVLLHGCGDTASNFASAWSEWTSLADQHQLALLFPEQQPENNVGGVSCFNWFETVNQTRNQGENLSIVQMVEKMKVDAQIDPSRVFVVGFSAGAATAINLIATQPDRFAAAVSVAGVAFTCARSLGEAFSCLDGQVDLSASTWSSRVRAAHQGYSQPYPRLGIWHGLSDAQVAPVNRRELLEQWASVHGIDETADATEPYGTNGTRREYRDASGAVRIETYEFAGVGHAIGAGWAERMARFFGVTGSPVPPEDTTPPSVSITAPAPGATVAGTVDVTGSASDDVGVTSVELLVDGTVVGRASSPSFSFIWDTRSGQGGTRTLKAVAYDAAGNRGQSAVVQVVVKNDGPPPTAGPGPGPTEQPRPRGCGGLALLTLALMGLAFARRPRD